MSAQLQGASLERAKLAGAVLYEAFVWRARFSLESIKAFVHEKIVWESQHRSKTLIGPKPWTEASYLALKKVIEEEVATPHSDIEDGAVQSGWPPPPAAAGRDAALKRIEILDPNKPFKFEAEVPKSKKKIDAGTLGEKEYKKALAEELRSLACSGDADAVYVVRGEKQSRASLLAANQRIDEEL